MACFKKYLPLVLAGVVALALGTAVHHAQSPYRTVYLGRCMMGGMSVSQCARSDIAYSKVEYLILKETQIAVRRDESALLETLNVCSIYDADNWNCLSKDVVMAMKDGAYKEAAVSGEGQEIRKAEPVSAFEYWRGARKRF